VLAETIAGSLRKVCLLMGPAVTLACLPTLIYGQQWTYTPGSFNVLSETTGASLQILAGCGKRPISSKVRNPYYAESVGEAV